MGLGLYRSLRSPGSEQCVHRVGVGEVLQDEHDREREEDDDQYGRAETPQNEGAHERPIRLRIASPDRLPISARRKIATAGITESHQSCRRYCRFCAVIAPSSGAGSGEPRPRNERAERVINRFETSRLAVTMTAGSAPGRRCRNAQRARARSPPKSRSLKMGVERQASGSRRARCGHRNGHQNTTIAMMVLSRLGPSEATIAIATIGPGSASIASVKRIKSASMMPPQAPAASPMAPPITTPDAMTTRAENQLVRMP